MEIDSPSLNSCEKPVIDILSEINIFRHHVEAKPPLGPLVCHPDIKLSEDELALLNRGPNFMVRNKIPLDTVRLEVEKGIIKHKYQVQDFDEFRKDDCETSNGAEDQHLKLCMQVKNSNDNFQIKNIKN